jgi:ribosomal protein L7/L12
MSSGIFVAGLIGFVLGCLCRMRVRTGDPVQRWQMEQRVDALLRKYDVRFEWRLPDECERLVKVGRLVDAARAYRQATGVGLKEAYAAVQGKDQMERKFDALLEKLGVRVQYALPDAVRAHLGAGRKIEAIKEFRETTGMGLGDARRMIERHADAAA